MINKQDFINAVTQDIDIVRGDTLAFNFKLTGLGSRDAYEDLLITFAIAQHYDDESIVEVTKENGIALEEYNAAKDTALFSVCVAPNMTKTLDLTRYYYDLQLKDDSNVVTLMRGRLKLLWDVAD